jgi:hypothetical protein
MDSNLLPPPASVSHLEQPSINKVLKRATFQVMVTTANFERTANGGVRTTLTNHPEPVKIKIPVHLIENNLSSGWIGQGVSKKAIEVRDYVILELSVMPKLIHFRT